MSSEFQKITVILPKGLLERLNRNISAHERNSFITEAIEERLELVEQVSALEEAAGAWSLENHPTMQDDKGIDKWLKDIRQSWR